MHNDQAEALAQMVLAPYIQKATALIGVRRKVGGNQFRHAMATLAILIDYKLQDPVLLKAAVIHDLLEDVPDTDEKALAGIDADGPAVLELVREVTRREESKPEFLQRIHRRGSQRARLLKLADRISNLTDLHYGTLSAEFVSRYLDETERHILPMALETSPAMAVEVRDLIRDRRALYGGAPG